MDGTDINEDGKIKFDDVGDDDESFDSEEGEENYEAIHR